MTDEAKALLDAATKRAALLHASAAWGSDEDGHLIDRLLDHIEAQSRENKRLRGALAEVLNDDEASMDVTWIRRARAALGEKQ